MLRNVFGRATMGGHGGAPPPPNPPNDDDNERDNRPGLLRNPHGRPNEPEGAWTGYEVLGKGGFGTAAVWIKTDHTQRVIDRMVIKEVSRPGSSMFDRTDTWWIDRDHQKYSMPKEAAIGMLLGPDPTMSGYHPSRISQYDTNLVSAFGYSVDTDRRTFRIYMEYVGHDSLLDIIENQNATRYFGGEPYGRPPSVPEPFCWYMLQRLALACRDMAEPARIRMRYPEWPNAEVIHHDIKAGNIWFAAPSRTSFPLYPRPKLGDFGGARVTYDGDEMNPLGWRAARTPGYMPPEMDRRLREVPHEEGIEFRTYATNIWQIGQTIRFMMQMITTNTRIQQISYPDVDDSQWTPQMTNLTQNYSPQLIDIVGRCVHQDAHQRPTPIEILQFCANNRDKTEYMSDPSRASLEENRRYRLLLVNLQDKYRLGMSLSDI